MILWDILSDHLALMLTWIIGFILCPLLMLLIKKKII